MMCVGLGLATTMAAAGCRASAEPPSVLLIVVDTLRADHVGALTPGDRPSPTPNLDRWATGATRFRRATTPAPFTMPAMAALLTGVYPDRCGIVTHMPGTTFAAWPGDTLPEAARRAGIATAAVVANPWLVRPGPKFDRGFDVFERLHGSGRAGRTNTAGDVTSTAISVLERMGRRRFLMWVHYFDPHMPYEPPPAFATAAGAMPTAAGSPDAENPVMRDFRRKGRDLGRIFRGDGYDPRDLDHARRLYEGEVRYVDAEIGRLLARLDELGLDENTLVIVASDHGEALGEHGLWFAHDYTLYDELLHVALMMRGPGVPAGTRDDLVSLLDVAPTLCRLAGLACGAEGYAFDGRDLFPPDRGGRTLFAAATPIRGRGAAYARLQVPGIDGRWTMAEDDRRKLVRAPTNDGATLELYDRIADPRDTSDVMAAHGDDAQRLAASLEAWRSEMADRRPVTDEPRGDAAGERRDERTLRSLGYLQ